MTEKDITLCGHGSALPTLKNMYDYLEKRYNMKAKNGKREGVVSVRRLKNLTDRDRVRFHDTYKTIIKRNIYSQDRRLYCYEMYHDGLYYSDCSSSGCLTFDKLGYKVGALNTAGIYRSSKFEDVPVNIKNGHIQNPEVLKVGDCILFVGNDASRPKQIGHVEYIYEINTEETEANPLATAQIKVGSDGLEVLDTLNIRQTPNRSGTIVGKCNEGDRIYPTARATINGVGWFKIKEGWVCGRYLRGWILDPDKKWWYLRRGYTYYQSTVANINGVEYVFDHEGYMVTPDRIAKSGEVKY